MLFRTALSPASILDQSLPIPSGPIERIAVIGDTGCRLNTWEKKYQNCNDPAEWPFATVAATVADWQPDLIVHVGDYLYRESPCPEDMPGCQGSPYGDNWQTWNADFFTPASPLLGLAPWLMMRGNHETCDRNAGGWFAYLDTRSFQYACQLFTEPYVTYLDGVTLAILDSAEASDEVVHPGEEEEYKRQFALLATLAPPGSWLTTHRPVWGLLEDQGGTYEVENASYEASSGDSLNDRYGLVLSGHIHLGEALTFDESSDRPPQLISGNSGTALDDVPEGSPSGEPYQPEVEEAETFSAFGFLTFEASAGGWVATQRNADGSAVLVCTLAAPQAMCEPAPVTTRFTTDNRRGRSFDRPLHRSSVLGLVVHAAWHWRRGLLLLRLVGDQRLGGQDHAGDRRRVLDRRARHLGRIDDAGLDHVDVLLGEHVVADVRVLLLLLRAADHLDHDRAILARVGGDAAQRLFQRAAQDVDAGLDVALGLDVVERRQRR